MRGVIIQLNKNENKMEKTENQTPSNALLLQKSNESDLKRTESDISNLSFKRWHKRMQTEHEILEKTGKTPFKLWKCCNKSFLPCRWFDSIDYNKKISKCCLTFKSFKNMVTICLVAVFLYCFMFAFLGNEVLPGGSVFFLLLLFLTAYLVGYLVTLVGMPGVIGHLVTGITFGNIPHQWLPNRDEEFMEKVADAGEKALLVIALIRGGLLLDLTRMKHRLKFIFYTAMFPFFCEFLVVWIASHFLLKLDWDWSALQGSTISIVSLATVTSIMEKNRKHGFGEDKHLSTVLIAAAVLNVLFGVILYCICLTFVIDVLTGDHSHLIYWKVLVTVLKQSLLGIVVGLVAGFLISFFPDKRNSEAAGLRIIVIGLASFGVASLLNSLDMNIAAALSCLLMCFICTNIWEEIGWHQDSNPVLYFYTMAYYISQPLVLSLLGYTLNLHESSGKDVGLSFAVFIIGLVGRELICFVVLREKSYTTTSKEKIFICIAWLTKGTFQVLLAFSVLPFIEKNKKDLQNTNKAKVIHNSMCIRRTTILATLLITPLACYCLVLLTPKLLTNIEDISPEEYRAGRQRNRLSISRYQDTVTPTRRISIKHYSDMGLLEDEAPKNKKENETKSEKKTGKKESTKEEQKETEKRDKEQPEKQNRKEPEETTSREPDTQLSKDAKKPQNKNVNKK